MKQLTVTFASAGTPLVAHLYIPAGPGPHSAIVVSHPAGGVKEQAAGLYARLLADHGFVTLAFDAAYNGESGGYPRGLEDPAHRVEDIKAAVSFLAVRTDVDAQRIAMLGICSSGGYVMAAAATDPRVKAVATVSGVDIGRFFRRGYDGKQSAAVLDAMLAQAAAARTAEARGEPPAAFPIFPADEAAARALGQYVYEGWDYYCTPRAGHARSTKLLPWASIDRIAGFDGFNQVDRIAPRPLLMIVGTRAETQWLAQEALARAGQPNELAWIEGASHVDLYDKPDYVQPAVEILAAFYGSALRG